MLIAAMSVAAVLAGSAPSVANGLVTIAPGESVVISLGPQGPVVADDTVLTKRENRPWGDGVRLKFSETADGGQTVLTVGYDRPVDYEARMFNAAGQNATTSICVVKPHMFSIEHWPHPIARLELSNFTFVSGMADDVMKCD